MSCCAQCPHIDLPSPESYQNNYNVIPEIYFYVYNLITGYTVHVRRPPNEKKQCKLCEYSSDTIVTVKFYSMK